MVCHTHTPHGVPHTDHMVVCMGHSFLVGMPGVGSQAAVVNQFATLPPVAVDDSAQDPHMLGWLEWRWLYAMPCPIWALIPQKLPQISCRILLRTHNAISPERVVSPKNNKVDAPSSRVVKATLWHVVLGFWQFFWQFLTNFWKIFLFADCKRIQTKFQAVFWKF
jgi:hypothetical protein